ncbi:MAG: hypothetical protein K2H28_01545 [Ruminococcus sp.]|nr:hypothetical protein [Ruminococcus sp.]
MSKHTLRNLDSGQLGMMWNFLQLKPENKCIKSDVKDLKYFLDKIRQALIQQSAGQRKNEPSEYIDFNDLGTYINNAIISALWLYINGGLDILENQLEENINKKK